MGVWHRRNCGFGELICHRDENERDYEHEKIDRDYRFFPFRPGPLQTRGLAKTPRRALLLRSLRPRPRRLVTAWSLWRADRFRLRGWDLLLSRLCVNLLRVNRLRLHLLLRVRLSRSALIVEIGRAHV